MFFNGFIIVDYVYIVWASMLEKCKISQMYLCTFCYVRFLSSHIYLTIKRILELHVRLNVNKS